MRVIGEGGRVEGVVKCLQALKFEVDRRSLVRAMKRATTEERWLQAPYHATDILFRLRISQTAYCRIPRCRSQSYGRAVETRDHGT